MILVFGFFGVCKFEFDESSVKHKMIYIFNWFLIEMANCFRCWYGHVCVNRYLGVCDGWLWP